MKLHVLLIAAVTLAGCATAYQPQGATGGFSESQLDENVFQVTFKGNGYTDRDRANNFTLLRSAEIALEKDTNILSLWMRSNIQKTAHITLAAKLFIFPSRGQQTQSSASKKSRKASPTALSFLQRASRKSMSSTNLANSHHALFTSLLSG